VSLYKYVRYNPLAEVREVRRGRRRRSYRQIDSEAGIRSATKFSQLGWLRNQLGLEPTRVSRRDSPPQRTIVVKVGNSYRGFHPLLVRTDSEPKLMKLRQFAVDVAIATRKLPIFRESRQWSMFCVTANGKSVAEVCREIKEGNAVLTSSLRKSGIRFESVDLRTPLSVTH